MLDDELLGRQAKFNPRCVSLTIWIREILDDCLMPVWAAQFVDVPRRVEAEEARYLNYSLD